MRKELITIPNKQKRNSAKNGMKRSNKSDFYFQVLIYKSEIHDSIHYNHFNHQIKIRLHIVDTDRLIFF